MSSPVVWGRQEYIQEANKQLSDTNFYEKLDYYPTSEHTVKVTQAINSMLEKGDIDNATAQYLLPTNTRAGRFYLLPKIHKPGIPGRPIISANNHPTEKISEFVDHHLRPLVQRLPSYIQDTTDYIRRIESIQSVPEGSLLVTMDVTSLYTNIPHDEGIEACRKALNERENQHPSTESLVELITLVLKLNNFEFNGEHYLQVNGTAMWTRMAPSYANIFMGQLEKTAT